MRKGVAEVLTVGHYARVHPALDFWDDKAIVSVGEQFQYVFEDGDIEFKDGEMSILSTGDSFVLTKKELANRQLFYNRTLDLPDQRWSQEDIASFCEEMRNGHKPIVDCKEVYQKIYDIIEYYLDYDDKRIYHVLAAFIVYTYFHPLFANAPILQFWGEQSTGKSKMCAMLEALAFNAVNSANISVSSVFRLVEGRRATLLLDEAEDLMNSERGRDISNLLLAGYSSGGITYRQEKQGKTEAYKTTSFRVFGPKVIANIAGISLTPLKSRIIQIVCTGTSDKEKANREINIKATAFKSIRDSLYRLVMLYHSEVAETKSKLPETELRGRSHGIWHGILTVAYWINPDVWKAVVEYANANSSRYWAEMADHPATLLLSQILILAEKGGDKDYQLDEILVYAHTCDDLKGYTAQKVAKMLNRMGFISQVKWSHGHAQRFYLLKADVIMDRIKRR